ncbi:hypothetical protein [Microcoleus sp. PH2017_08_TRC_O_A]|jgi:hypothetical protein|uniref:hypothetical protein n=1 Tax=Microcoleus sp. PH2017_08_TRC_O_A TaxID=2798819 RepID=UPI001DE823F8|nr:hypothetical protein [Microcoleus sp. PH2017_08_TRC_O_A]MCC3454626.1 hypothetical protein [Microcoleus sp. PH2017_08_TRC_O_A]MCC3510693.1 hypothetical protein [Microcoleus sp. PH2017_17_BER_D_A]
MIPKVKKIWKYQDANFSQFKNDTISSLLELFIESIFFTVVIFGLALIIYLVVLFLNSPTKVDINVVSGLIQGGTAIVALLFQFLFLNERIKNRIVKEINKFETKFSEEYVYPSQTRVKQLEQNPISNFRKEQQRYYATRAYIDNKKDEAIKGMTSTGSFPLEYINMFDTPGEAKAYYENTYSKSKGKRRLRALVTTIEKLFWIRLATNSVLHTFNLDRTQLDKLESGPERFLYRDIKAYLYAWLVCSIDNIEDDVTYMPVKYIGLNYPNQGHPEIKEYKKALDWLIEQFDSGDFANHVGDIQIPQEDLETYKEISPYLNQLITLLNDYKISLT